MLPDLINSINGLHPFLELIADRICYHRSTLPDLKLGSPPEGLQSISVNLDGEAGFIKNEIHLCKGLRKIHLEIARLGGGLEILHCVFFPDPAFDLPIFGTDVVIGPGGISAAILDLSPVKNELPVRIINKLENISRHSFNHSRPLPEWGTIFSPYVCFVRPVGKHEENIFLHLVDQYLQIVISSLAEIIPDDSDSPFTIERHRGQTFYCLQQKRNDKTRNVLANVFSPQWAERYIEEVLFDCPAPT